MFRLCSVSFLLFPYYARCSACPIIPIIMPAYCAPPYTLVREAILHHMLQIAHFMLSHLIIGHSSVSEYIQHTSMDQDGTWGTDIEIFTLSHFLNTCIFVYTTEQCNWWRYGPQDVDRSLNVDITNMSMYTRNPGLHFDVVCSTFASI